jgi:Copper transport outer membrane protein, MctB
MINFRFHIVSLIAVFLALGLGILAGSAIVNGAIVDRLDREIDQVRSESDQLRASNREANEELDRTNQYAADSAAYSVDGRLTGVPVALVAERGVDDEDVNDTLAMLRAAGADAPAIFWLESSWKLESEEDAEALRTAVDLLGGAASVRVRALNLLAQRLTEPRDAVAAPGTDVIDLLVEGGFLEVDGDDVDLATFPPRPARAVVVTGTTSDFRGTDMTVEMTSAFVDADAPTVVGEVFVAQDGADPPARGSAVASVRTDEALAEVVSTVDDLELVPGRVATVIALQDLANGIVGHYGYGEGATSSLPPRPDA